MTPPATAASPAARADVATTVGGGNKHGNGHGNGNGNGGSGVSGFFSGLMHRVFNPKTLVFAGLGAAAAMYIPPLAVLGGPIGGAIVGALLAQVL